MFIKRLAPGAVGPVRRGLLQRQGKTEADLRSVQILEGSSGYIADMVTVLEQGGCVVESVIDLGAGRWQVTAQSQD